MKHCDLHACQIDDPKTIDAASRAAHLWLTHLFTTSELCHDTEQRHALAGGFIWQLCQGLSLKNSTTSMVAYVYALLNKEGTRAVAVSRTMLSCGTDPALAEAFLRGAGRAHDMIVHWQNDGFEALNSGDG